MADNQADSLSKAVHEFLGAASLEAAKVVLEQYRSHLFTEQVQIAILQVEVAIASDKNRGLIRFLKERHDFLNDARLHGIETAFAMAQKRRRDHITHVCATLCAATTTDEVRVTFYNEQYYLLQDIVLALFQHMIEDGRSSGNSSLVEKGKQFSMLIIDARKYGVDEAWKRYLARLDSARMVSVTFIIGERLTYYNTMDFTVEKIDSSGGFGLILFGHDRVQHNRKFALKTLKPRLFQSKDIRERFIREASVWFSMWPHANIVPVHDLVEMKGIPFIVIEYMEQGNLRQALLREEGYRFTWAQNIAAGLAYLHKPEPKYMRKESIVHRDLKPEKVLIGSNGYAAITDFGLAKIVGENAESLELLNMDREVKRSTQSQRMRTQNGDVIGTPAYIAPEVWVDPGNAGPAADMYAFGLMLAEIFFQKSPLLDLYQWHALEEWQHAHLHQRPQLLRPPEKSHDLIAALDPLYMACLEKDPHNRPTAQEALKVLQGVAMNIGLPPYQPPDILEHTQQNELHFWTKSAKVLYRVKQYEEAKPRLEHALALNQRDYDLWLKYAHTLDELGRVEESLTALERCIAFIPAEDKYSELRIIAQGLRCIALRDLKRFAEAESSYAQMETVDGSAKFWYDRASNEAMWYSHEFEASHRAEALAHVQKGIDYSRRSLQLDPTNNVVQGLLKNLQGMIPSLKQLRD